MMNITPKDIDIYAKCIALTNNAAVFDIDIYLKPGLSPVPLKDKIGEVNLILNLITKDVSLTSKMYHCSFESTTAMTLFLAKECQERCTPILNTTEPKTEQV